MIQQIERAASTAQISTTTERRQTLEAMTDQELQGAIQRLSIEIEARKAQRPVKANQPWIEQMEWEAAICSAMDQRESLHFALLYRSIEKLREAPVIQTSTYHVA